ncbi:response regulator transcription factor [Pseudomonas sp. S1_E04]
MPNIMFTYPYQAMLMVNICVVDDDISVRKSLSNLLKSAGYQAVSYSCGEDFLASEFSILAACVLLDIRMQGMSGNAVLQVLKSSGREIPVICMSAHWDEELVAEILAIGAVGYLHKPFTGEALFQAVAKALDV